MIAGAILAVAGAVAYGYGLGLSRVDFRGQGDGLAHALQPKPKLEAAAPEPKAARVARRNNALDPVIPDTAFDDEPASAADAPVLQVKAPKPAPKESVREQKEAQATFAFAQEGGFQLPELSMLTKSKPRAAQFDEGALERYVHSLSNVKLFADPGTVTYPSNMSYDIVGDLGMAFVSWAILLLSTVTGIGAMLEGMLR